MSHLFIWQSGVLSVTSRKRVFQVVSNGCLSQFENGCFRRQIFKFEIHPLGNHNIIAKADVELCKQCSCSLVRGDSWSIQYPQVWSQHPIIWSVNYLKNIMYVLNTGYPAAAIQIFNNIIATADVYVEVCNVHVRS